MTSGARRVYLTTTGDNAMVETSRDDYLRVRESAEKDRCGRHVLVDAPEDADLVLFVGSRESDFWDVRRHPLVRARREDCFLYHSEDAIVPFLPGVYPSLLASDSRLGRAVAGGYSAVLHIDIPHLEFDPDAKYLYSFRGSLTSHPVRGRLRTLQDLPRGYVEDSSDARAATSAHAPGTHRPLAVELMRSSKFCLCPRGRGPSSWRLFETMRAGRVPVIISDDWTPPPITPSWDSVSIRVRERDVVEIPKRLEEREPEAERLALAARLAWEEWFSMETFFHRIVDWCEAMRISRRVPERCARFVTALSLAHPRKFRHFVVPRLRRSLRRAAACF